MDPGCGLQGSFDARLVARPRVRAGHLVGNSRVYGIIDNENMYYIPTRLEMHRMAGWALYGYFGGAGLRTRPGTRLPSRPTLTEATFSDPPTGDSHARSHYARRTHGPRATTRVGLRRYCPALATIAGRDFDLPE